MAKYLSSLLIIVLILLSEDNRVNSSNLDTITVATYNVWNVMFNWNVRKFRIAQMIKEADPHIIAFQELRSSSHHDPEDDLTQLSDLQELLPQYRWKQYAPAHGVTPLKDTYITEWNQEGIGILSRLPIIRHRAQNLTTSGGPDKNTRVVLHVSVLLDQSYYPDTSKTVDVMAVHFSYDKQQQCSNALDVIQYIQDKQLTNTIILGDFNSYKDHESPMQVFTETYTTLPCSLPGSLKPTLGIGRNRRIVFKDSWLEANPGKSGLTFSNMPQPGLESRPDRILVSDSAFHVQSAQTVGDGSRYRSRFFYHIIWSRLEGVLGSAYDSYKGHVGRPCVHDCGPHASCRCGVCVSGGDKRVCHLPDCDECSSRTIYTVIVFTLIFLGLLAQLIFGTLQVMLTLNERGRSNYPRQKSLVCCNICICDPELYSNFNAKLRGFKRRRLCQVWPLLRLPPMMLVIVTILMMFMYGEFMLYAFKDAINDVYSIIPEELNPSDHLMLYTTLNIKDAKVA